MILTPELMPVSRPFNIAGGKETANLVAEVRAAIDSKHPNFPIIASGGKTDEQITATIEAGANAVTFAAYGVTEATFHAKMRAYRKQKCVKLDLS